MIELIEFKNTIGQKKSMKQFIDKYDFHILEISALLKIDMDINQMRKEMLKVNKNAGIVDDNYLLFTYELVKNNMSFNLSNFKCVLYIENYKLIGFIIYDFKTNGKRMSIEYILIDDKYRNRGLGDKLIKMIIDIYNEKRKNKTSYKIRLECEKELIEYYKKYGFVVVDKEKYKNIKNYLGERLFKMDYKK